MEEAGGSTASDDTFASWPQRKPSLRSLPPPGSESSQAQLS